MSKKKKEFFKKNKAQRKNDSPVKAKKHLGQHFLTDEAIAQQIAETLTHNGYTNVIEIGPGTGVLT
ncbi:rRNA adenine N-6-methyltransferase family protein, partial [Mammaliicoccus sciuri]